MFLFTKSEMVLNYVVWRSNLRRLLKIHNKMKVFLTHHNVTFYAEFFVFVKVFLNKKERYHSFFTIKNVTS